MPKRSPGSPPGSDHFRPQEGGIRHTPSAQGGGVGSIWNGAWGGGMPDTPHLSWGQRAVFPGLFGPGLGRRESVVILFNRGMGGSLPANRGEGYPGHPPSPMQGGYDRFETQTGEGVSGRPPVPAGGLPAPVMAPGLCPAPQVHTPRTQSPPEVCRSRTGRRAPCPSRGQCQNTR